MKANQGAQYEISVDGVPRTYRDRQDIALQNRAFSEVQESAQRGQDEAPADWRGDRGGIQVGAVIPMPLKLRPTGLGHGVYKDNVDYGVFCGEWCIGRIYQTRTGPESLRWFALLPNKPPELPHRQPRGDARCGKGRVRGELDAVESVGGVGRSLKSAADGWLDCGVQTSTSAPPHRGAFSLRVPPTLCAGLLKSSRCPTA